MNTATPNQTDLPSHAEARDASTRQPPRVLVVDGHQPDVFVIACYLQQFGCPFDIASSKDAIAAMLKARKYDVVFVDAVTSGIDHPSLMHLVESAKTENKLPRPRVVAMTASTFIGSPKSFDGTGVDGFLAKPCNPRLLAEKLGIKI